MGTRIHNVRLTEVVDGDTIKVELTPGGPEETLRLLVVDTEESAIGSKPVTTAGREVSQWAKNHFGCDAHGFPVMADVRVDLEFDTLEPKHLCLANHRGHWGRLLCYVHWKGENYNLMAVRQGWSPYFVKYGRSRLYHKEFLQAEAEAQAESRLIWDPATNDGGNSRDYDTLLPWWHLRDGIIQEYRTKGVLAGVLSPRSQDYNAIATAAKNGETITVLCDLSMGVSSTPGNGALLENVGSSSSETFWLWIPNRNSGAAESVLNLIEKRYASGPEGRGGRGFVFVTAPATIYNGIPEIVVTSTSQLSDVVPTA